MKQTLIVLPGWARNKHSYKKLVATAPKGWRIIIPSYHDLALYKGSSEFGKRILSLMKKHSLSSVYLLGHSVGGAFAIHFASYYPHKIKKLFLVNSKGIANGASLFAEIRLFFSYKKRTITEHAKVLFRLIKSPVSNFHSGLFAHYAHLEKAAGKIRVPTTIFWGEKDSLTPVSHGKKMQSYIKNSKLFVFKDVGHDWLLHNPEKFWTNI